MKFIIVKNERLKASKKAFEKRTGMKVPDKHGDQLPVYQLVNDDLTPVVKERKEFDGNKVNIIKENVIVSQAQINAYKKMGQTIEIIDLKAIEAEKKAFEKAIADAFEAGKKAAKKEAENAK